MYFGDNNEKIFGQKYIIESIGLNEFEEKVVKETEPVLLLCIQNDYESKNQLHGIEDNYRTFLEKVKIYLLEEDALKTFKEKFDVKGTPTFLLFINGRERGRWLGQAGFEELDHFLTMMLSY
jgi:thiol-disulfide isomerase/thioredoxin